MKLEEIYKLCEFNVTPGQDKIIRSIDGPNLIIAGPGSGKSEVLLFRTINLIVNHNISTKDIVLCTFTEKAAAQLIERLAFLLEKINQDINIYDLKFGTIHSICSKIIDENIELTDFKNNYDILDEITQYLFINENFNTLLEPLEFGQKYLYKWPISNKTETIKYAIEYLNKITEENVNINNLKESKDLFHRSLGMLYDEYYEVLKKYNKIDFPHLQKEALKVIRNHEKKKLRASKEVPISPFYM